MNPNPPRPPRQQGIAIVLTLGILAILSIMVIAFVVSMQTEQTAARNFNYESVARQLAQAAVGEAIMLLRTNTPAITTNNYYVTQPGRVICTQPFAAPYTSGSVGALYSTASWFTPNMVDLNADRNIITSNSVYSTVASRVISSRWTNVGNVNIIAPSPPFLSSVSAGIGPMIGRYAFWVDDEASKLNINSAGTRSDRLGQSTTNIDLSVLGSALGGNTRTYAVANGFFTTEQWKDSAGVGPVTYRNNAPYITAYSADTPITPWGTNRVDLNSATFSQLTNVLSDASFSAPTCIFSNIVNSAIPGNDSFFGKYSTNGLNQIAANIYDFCHAGDDSTTDSQAAPTYCGLKATPYLNEIIISGTASSSQVVINAQIELVNPYNTAKGNGYSVVVNYILTDSASSGMPSPVVNTITIPVTADVNAKNYGVVSGTLLNTNVSLTTSPTIRVAFPMILLRNTANNLVDFASNLTNPIPVTTFITIPTNGTSVTKSIGAVDPRANDTMVHPVTGALLWMDEGTGTGTNKNTNCSLGATSLAGATDATNDGNEPGGAVTMADPLTHSTFFIKNAPFVSPGELGFIHTGQPWRTLRLQPRITGTRLPDWVVLDLFTTSALTPTNTAGQVIGRLNLNQSFFTLSPAPATRLLPLQSLFTNNVALIAANEVNTLAQNIQNRTFVTTQPGSFLPNAFNLIGELCEVQGLANTNTVVSDVKSNREARVASVANLVTVRSNTFTIWGIAQAIAKTPNSTGGGGPPAPGYEYRPDLGDQIMAEAKIQAVVERYEMKNPPITGTTTNVGFRVLYFRYFSE